MRYYGKSEDLLNLLHITDIVDEFQIMLVSILFEEKVCEKLMLGKDLL
jgi:hypothetical protein